MMTMADTIFKAATGLPLLPADEANERIVTLTAILREFVVWGPFGFGIGGDCSYCLFPGKTHEPECLWLRAKELLDA